MIHPVLAAEVRLITFSYLSTSIMLLFYSIAALLTPDFHETFSTPNFLAGVLLLLAVQSCWPRIGSDSLKDIVIVVTVLICFQGMCVCSRGETTTNKCV